MKVGIALSGGGALGAAHIGALKALDEAGITPHHITGISAGAIVGALYCAGNKPDDILSFFEMDSLLELVSLDSVEGGLIDTERFQKIIRENSKSDDFSNLAIKLSIGVTNLNTGDFEIFEEGQLSQIAGASSAVPLLMKPVKIGSHQYVDGGLINNLLVEPLKETCDFVIGINANPHEDIGEISGAKEVAKRCFEIIAGSSVKANSKECDFFLESKGTSKYALFDFKHSKEIFDVGYNEMKAELDSLKEKMEGK